MALLSVYELAALNNRHTRTEMCYRAWSLGSPGTEVPKVARLVFPNVGTVN